MTTNARSMAVGVFTDEAQAQQAIDDLQHAGFSNDQMRYSARKGGTGITDSLQNLGLPQEEATFYNSEFEAGRTVMTVNTDDRQQDAYDIMHRYGAYDYSRSAQAPGYNSTTGTGTDTRQYDSENAQHVQLREEEL